MYKTVTFYGRTFQSVLLHELNLCRGPTTPTLPKQYWFGLFPVRSPLLRKSRLFSFPAGTKMFQFPALAFITEWYIFNISGCPIRKSSDQRLFAPTRSLSQLITSFIASESQGIRHTPLFAYYLLYIIDNNYFWSILDSRFVLVFQLKTSLILSCLRLWILFT